MRIFPYFITEEIHFISAFNDKQESQIDDFNKNIEDHIEVSYVKSWHQDSSGSYEEGVDQVEFIGSISEADYDVREIFTEVMPVYQRQAMLLTLWGGF